MLTIQQLKDMPEFTVFAHGVTTDNPEGINMSGSGRSLRWLACRGQIHDWTIYAHFAENTDEWVRLNGDKVGSAENIKKLVPCDDEAYGMYRH